ncbi:signal peptidase I [Thermosulfuriphilus sp.]
MEVILAKQKKDFVQTLREYAQAILLALILALFIRTFIVQAFKIPSGSMIPTLLVGDHILVNKFIYGVKNPLTRETWISFKKPKRGDVIVFIYPLDRHKDFIKRVIGVGGDVVEIVNKRVYVNGKPLEEPYVIHTDPKIIPGEIQPRDNMPPVKVPAGYLFVMGDNRDQSYDSRFWGFVPLKDVKGKAFIIYWSWDKNHFRIRWRRIGHLIH